MTIGPYSLKWTSVHLDVVLDGLAKRGFSVQPPWLPKSLVESVAKHLLKWLDYYADRGNNLKGVWKGQRLWLQLFPSVECEIVRVSDRQLILGSSFDDLDLLHMKFVEELFLT